MLKKFERAFTIPHLSPKVGAEMLLIMRKDEIPLLYRNPFQLAQHPLMTDNVITPQLINDIAFLLSKDMDLTEIYHKLNKNGAYKNEGEDHGQLSEEKKNFLE
jgi:hypothetical protein